MSEISAMGGFRLGVKKATCAHQRVVYVPTGDAAEGRCDRWECDSCGHQFAPTTHDGADYDHSIHSNPDARAWAAFFCKNNLAINQDTMVGWFANAMMAMHDHLKREMPEIPESAAASSEDQAP